MKLRALALAIATSTVVSAAVASSSALAAHAASACIPTIKSVDGHTEVGYCGPATATLTIGGKTYKFSGGTCQKDPGANMPLSLTLGWIVAKVSANNGLPQFQLSLVTDGALKIDTVTADYGGKVLASVDSVSVKGSIPASGTFASAKGALSGSTALTGTWNCHGLVDSTP
ncbi:MAG: hypothetical protein ABSC56_11370 [Solirubrobacteraceae bacterium]|jgi:hypothetical protein